MDLSLLQLVREKSQLIRFKPHLVGDQLQPWTLKIIDGIEAFFAAHPATDKIEWSEFREWFMLLRSAEIQRDSRKLLTTVFDQLAAGKGTGAVAEDILDMLLRKVYAAQSKDAIDRILLGDTTVDMADVVEPIEEYDRAVRRGITHHELFAPFSFTELAKAISKPGLPWRLKELDRSLGQIRGGDFIVVAARPEVGKTTFGADQVSYMAEILETNKDPRHVFWNNNEEVSHKVAFRVMQASLGMTKEDILKDLPWAEGEANRRMGVNRVRVTRNDAGLNNRRAIEAWLRNNPPALIVFDQLDKVDGFESANDKDDQRIGAAYKWARDLGHQYDCPVIAFSQCSAEAEGMQWIPQSLLRGSKTDKPGEADAIITIGKLPEEEYDRYINICKNKLVGNVEAERHFKYAVKIDPTTARYVGLR